MKKVLLYFFVFIAIQVVCGLIIGLRHTVTGSQDMTAMDIIVSSSSASVITILLFTLAKWTPFSTEYIKQRPWAAVYWCVILALGMLIPSQFLEELIPASMTTDILADQFKMVMGNSWGYLAVGLLAPCAEELVFRGGIQRAAINFFEQRLGNSQHPTPNTQHPNLPHWVGIVITALLFSAMHGNPAQMPHAFLVGLLLGWLCYRSGSIIPGVIVHWVNNTAAYLLYVYYPQSYDMKMADFFGHEPWRICLAIVFSLMLFLPALYQLNLRLKKPEA